ncbi:methionine ABC transporter ATP-binding protein [Loigolactobacillus backii]|uniref:Methionine ABC transporter ATP-binding protein n=1 Tax=Loigolactobacillus backii TaxID=375175 RepID=A0A192H4Q5_9LACO|nr:methionine ABC transporter ATP-binding protein [Loigolactobacillus backii]ANK59862.1 methionine ABC transporter ATP-binding protein [Loigolactobacillus backii]ANK63197.1 methionine ABC transporter ATP-binding protein [Loigolactobacillus backii]ANK64795.1 methionine ABC transporter ATP-binding protein [Loigolactobacillus backii]ANK66757.1 methionine ABC transporter ATP-binding protein [Loigolactobacillus backii]ANK69797.1 methionine ABC transporter ATP-binding protein [Loigolactobacillus bac
MIDIKGVSKVFKGKKQITAVEDVNLQINDGEIYGIVGYSGAGKSTLVRMFNGLETPTTGTVTINDTVMSDLHGKELREKRQKMGMIFQYFNLLWSRTVLQNVTFPLELTHVPKEERQAKAEKLIETVGLKGRENAYPSELSGGQQQRVAIARALANDPELLLSDEATSGLDPKTTDEVLELLLKINRELNITIVVITHEMHVIRKICDRMAVMDAGRVVEEGSVFDIFRHPQKEITRQFVSEEETPQLTDTNVVINELLKQVPTGKIVKLTFHGDQAKLPIISEMLRQFPEIDLNIVDGSIHQTQEGSIGTLYLQLLGNAQEIIDAQDYLHKMRVETEVIRGE